MVATTAGTNPASTSKINMIYQSLTHAVDMDKLRLKCADYTIAIGKDMKDAYAYQGEVKFTAASIEAGGEVAVMGLVLDGGADTVTCTNIKVLNLTARGAGLPVNASGLYIQSESGCTLTDGIRIQTLGTITNGILFGNTAGTSATCPTNMFKVPAAGSGFVTSLTGGNGSDDSITFDNPVSLKIRVGSETFYLVAGKDPKSA